MVLEIIKYPHRQLRQKSLPVANPTDPEIKQLVLDMLKTLRAHNAVGLAAPQIGKNLQLCIIEIEDEVFVLINPIVKKLVGEEIVAEEGCLSFPNKFLSIPRAHRVKVKALDSNGKIQILRAKGLLARAIQHEVDHLNGELFVDKATEGKDFKNLSL